MALAERAEVRGIAARVIDALSFAPPWFAKLYVDTHLRSSAYIPHLYGSAYFASNHRTAVDGELRRWFDQWIGKPLFEEVQSSDPLAVITTHFFPMGKLASARQRGKLSAPLVEVVTDYAAHAVWAEPGADAYCAPRGRASADLVHHGIARSRVVPTGIPVRAAFAEAPPLASPAPGEPLRVLITSGGFGVGPIGRVLRSFAPPSSTGDRRQSRPAAHLTMICGQNPRLVRRVQRISDRFGLDASVIGFEREMPARVAQAHVVVTKPGGLTVTECLAAGRPLVLVGAVPGQESLNQAWVTESGAGLAVAPDDVGEAVEMLRRSTLLEPMAQRARALVVPDAADRVLDVTLSLASVSRRRNLVHPSVGP